MEWVNIWVTPIIGGERSDEKVLQAWSTRMFAMPRSEGGSIISVFGAPKGSAVEVAESPVTIAIHVDMEQRKRRREQFAVQSLAGLLANPAYRTDHDDPMRYRETAADAQTYADLLIAVLEPDGVGRLFEKDPAEELRQKIDVLRDLLSEVAEGDRPEMGWDDWQRRVRLAIQ